MKFLEFKTQFDNTHVVDIRNVETFFNGIDRRRLYEWQKRGLMIRLSNNYYGFADMPVNDQGLRAIASRVYQPSYVGLQSALGYYGFIPEAVFQVISITTRRNKTLKNPVANFRYRKIKESLFFGYNAVDEGLDSFFISDPEKTILDMLYFLPASDQKDVLEEMRFNLREIRSRVNPVKIKDYLKIFDSPKMETAVKLLMEMANVES